MKLEEIEIQKPSFAEAVKSSETVDLYAATLILQSRLYSKFLTGFIKKNKPWEVSLKILEVGCGPGEASCLLAKAGLLDGKTYLGIDLESQFINLAKQRNARFSNLSFEQKNILESVIGKYDMILAIAVLQHLGDAKTAISKLRKNLKAGGHLVLFDTGADTFSDCVPGVSTLQKMYDYISVKATDGKRNDQCLLELERHAADWDLTVELADDVKMPVSENSRDDFVRCSYFASELTKRFYNSPVSQADLLSELIFWRNDKAGRASLTGWRIVQARIK